MNARRIVVPLDGSGMSEAALSQAIEIATSTPGAITTLVRAAARRASRRGKEVRRV